MEDRLANVYVLLYFFKGSPFWSDMLDELPP